MFKMIRNMFREYEKACREAAKAGHADWIYTPSYGMMV